MDIPEKAEIAPEKKPMPTKIQIDRARCKKCGFCVEICPETVFTQKSKNSYPKVAFEKNCISCGHCVDICPGKAVIHRDFMIDSAR